MISSGLHDHLHKAALNLPERVALLDLKRYLNTLNADLSDCPDKELLSGFDQHKEWHGNSQAFQAGQAHTSPPGALTPPHTSRTDESPPRQLISRGASPVTPQVARPLYINPVCTKDKANPKILQDLNIPVEVDGGVGNINYIALGACKMFGHWPVEIGQKVLITYTPQNETQILNKQCIVREWGKGHGQMTANIIFARERPTDPQLSDAPAFLETPPIIKNFLEPTFRLPQEQRLYDATFHSKEFLECFFPQLRSLCIESKEPYPLELDSRKVHDFKFACWVAWYPTVYRVW